MSDDVIRFDGELHFNQSCWIDDWYVIENAQGRRIGGADIEGTAEDMRNIATAIETRGRFSATRCRAWTMGDHVHLDSPRNSIRATRVPLAVADALAKQIRTTLGNDTAPAGTSGE